MPRLINPLPSRIHDVNDFTDENRTDRGEGLKAATGLSDTTVGTVKASGSIDFSGVPLANDTITVNGVTFTFIAGASSGTDIHIEATAAAQATAVAAILEAAGSGGTGVDAATYTNPSSGKVFVEAKVAGVAGNAITLAEAATNVTVSGATLSGGRSYNAYASVIKNFMHG